MDGTCGTRNTEKEDLILFGIPEGKRQLGRPRCSREDNIKMSFKEGLNCFQQTRNRAQWRV
jgi:hypothetical protein